MILRQKSWCFLFALLVLAGFIAAGCSLLKNHTDKPNIILIVIDTLRADRLGVMGNQNGLTPNLDNIAGEGVLFTNCYAPSPWTIPSMASIMTGLYPAQHGVEFGLAKDGKKISQQKLNKLYATLPKQLKWQGYSTYGFVTNAHLLPDFGFGQGFDTYEVEWWENATWVANKVKSNVKKIKSERPYFLFLHFFDPHEPYYTHWQYRMEFPKGYDQSAVTQIASKKLSEIMTLEGFGAGSPELEIIETLYDGEVKYADDYVGKTLGTLGVTDQDIVIITADHGEGFYEHGRLGHGVSVYNELLHVPLIIRFPNKRFAGQRINDYVSLVDLMKTVCSMAGFQPKGHFEGYDLVDALNTKVFPERSLYASLKRPAWNYNAMISRDWKLIQDMLAEKSTLYNIRLDYEETSDQASSNPEVTARMDKELTGHAEQKPRFPVQFGIAASFDKSTLDKFREVGYLN